MIYSLKPAAPHSTQNCTYQREKLKNKQAAGYVF